MKFVSLKVSSYINFACIMLLVDKKLCISHSSLYMSNQMVSLEAWDSMDRYYSDSLLGAVEALRASTLRLPVVAGARVL